MKEWIDRQILNRQIDTKLIDRQVNEWMKEWIDRQIDTKQIDRYNTSTQTYLSIMRRDTQRQRPQRGQDQRNNFMIQSGHNRYTTKPFVQHTMKRGIVSLDQIEVKINHM